MTARVLYMDSQCIAGDATVVASVILRQIDLAQ